MNFKQSISKIISKYGESVSFSVNNVSYSTQAFIQSQRAMNKTLSEGEYLQSGYDTNEEFLYWGLDLSAVSELPVNTVIQAQSGNYIVKSFSKAYLAGKCVYVWAKLEKQVL